MVLEMLSINKFASSDFNLKMSTRICEPVVTAIYRINHIFQLEKLLMITEECRVSDLALCTSQIIDQTEFLLVGLICLAA